MFGVTDYGAFVIAVIVFLAIPGPGKGGARGGLAATPGRSVPPLGCAVRLKRLPDSSSSASA